MSYNNISKANCVGWCGRIDRVYDVKQCPVTAWIVDEIIERKSSDPPAFKLYKGISIGLSVWDVLQFISHDMDYISHVIWKQEK